MCRYVGIAIGRETKAIGICLLRGVKQRQERGAEGPVWAKNVPTDADHSVRIANHTKPNLADLKKEATVGSGFRPHAANIKVVPAFRAASMRTERPIQRCC